jgi:hypothetical protein
LRGGIVNRGAEVWAVSLVLTLVGMALAVGAWAVSASYGAPPLSSIAIALGVAVLVGSAIGRLIRWFAG